MVDITNDMPSSRRQDGNSPLWIIVFFAILLLLIGVGVRMNRHEDISVWVRVLGVFATLSIFSLLYRENPFFRFVEHIYIGLATGFSLVFVWIKVVEQRWWPQMVPASILPKAMQDGPHGQWWLIFCLLIGLLFFTVYFAKLSWMNRFALCIFMGFFAGAALQGFIGGLGPQIVAAFRPPVTTYSPSGVAPDNNMHLFGLWWHPWWLVAIIVLTCTMAYFFFSIEHRQRWIKAPAKGGRYLLMITLGAIFGTTVMGRFSLIIERFNFLINAWGDGWAWFINLFLHKL